MRREAGSFAQLATGDLTEDLPQSLPSVLKDLAHVAPDQQPVGDPSSWHRA